MAGKSGSIRAGRAFVELFADDSQLVRGLRSAQRRIRAFGTAVNAASAKLMQAGTLAAAPLALATGIFTRFSDRMNEVRAITGAAGDDFDRLNAKAKELGGATSFSASEVAEGMKFLGMAGFTTEQILAGIPAVLQLAKAGAVDLGLAADIASDVGSAFGMSADQIGHLADVMSKTATSANTSVALMGESFKLAAPIAKAAGQSIEETSAAIGILGNNAVKGSMAGTDIKNMLSLLAGQAKETMQSFGVATSDAEGNLRPMLDVMRDFGEATRHLSGESRLNLFMETFGKISGKSALILADAGEQVDMMRQKLDAASGSAAEAAEVMEAGLGGAFRSLVSASESVAIAVGEAGESTIRGWADSLKEIATLVREWAERNPGLVKSIFQITAALIGASVALKVVGLLFGGLAAAMGLVATAVGVVVGAIGLLFTPIGLIAAGLTAGIAAFLAWTEAGRNAGRAISRAFEPLGEKVATSFRLVVRAVKAGKLQEAFQFLSTVIRHIWDGLMEALKFSFNEMLAAVAQGVIELMAAMPDRLRDLAPMKGLIVAQNKLLGLDTTEEQAFAAHRQRVEREREFKQAVDDFRRVVEEAEAGQGSTPQTVADEVSESLKLPEIPRIDFPDLFSNSSSVMGTFSAAAVRGLAGSSFDRTAKASEETARNTARMLDELRDDRRGLKFT